jgi:hypothetical protein
MWTTIIIIVVVIVWILRYLQDREHNRRLEYPECRKSELKKIVEEEYQSYWSSYQRRLDKFYLDLQSARETKDKKKINETKASIRMYETSLENIQEIKKDFDDDKSPIWNNITEPYSQDEIEISREDIGTEFTSYASSALYAAGSKKKLKRD